MDAARKTLEKKLAGYFLAVTGATFVFTALFAAIAYYQDTSTLFSPADRLGQLALMTGFLGVLFWFLTFLLAAIPVFAISKLAEYFKITHPTYFVICGALTAIFLSAVYLRRDERPFIEELLMFMRLTVPAGIVGGFLYWWKAVRHQ
jgi:hypothetical protein